MARLHLIFSASAAAAALAGCFTGGFLAGQPCQSDAECGPVLSCENGFCAGASAGGPSPGTDDTTTSTDPTVEPPTTASTSASTTVEPDMTTTTGPEPTTTPVDPTGDSTTGEPCGIGKCKDLDLLLVLDNSPSMEEEYNVLLAALLAFQDKFLPLAQQACSIHLGVTTSDPGYAQNPATCRTSGALVQASSNGTPCTFVEGNHFATLPDFDDLSTLSCMFDVGHAGSGDEEPIAALLALPMNFLNNTECNMGFLRKDSFRVVVIATDEDDDDGDAQGHSGSNTPIELWDDSFKALWNIDRTLVFGMLGDPDPATTKCPWMPFDGSDGSGAESAPNLRGFIESLPEDRRVIGSLCQDQAATEVYQALMQEVSDKVLAACEAG